MPDRDDRENTPVEVPFPKYEGPTDPRLKGHILDPRITPGPDSDSERPAPPTDLGELARAFRTMAVGYASREIQSSEAIRKSNALLELVSAQLKSIATATVAPSPPYYWLLVCAVAVLTIMQLSELAILRHVLQLLAHS